MIYICTALHLSLLRKEHQKPGSPRLRFPVSITIEQARDYVRDFRYCSNVRSEHAAKTLSQHLGISLDMYSTFGSRKLEIDDNILIGSLVPFNFRIGAAPTTPQQRDIEWWIV